MQEHTHREFLERVPPGTKVFVSDLEFVSQQLQNSLRTPDIELHCINCAGTRFFAYLGSPTYIGKREPLSLFLSYHCRNCRSTLKRYAASYAFDKGADKWTGFKYGEDPAFGPPTPARAITLIGPDRDQFLKGRRCENQGLGVGAFVYYRRVVENQKKRIFEEIIRVSRHLGAEEALLKELEAAQNEVQFTRAVETVKHALPQSLQINGYNPLTLLHSALSEGVHDLSDEQCLEMASSVRVVLIEFAERVAQAMKDEAELNEAINRLANKKAG
jgi:hypothetical protein